LGDANNRPFALNVTFFIFCVQPVLVGDTQTRHQLFADKAKQQARNRINAAT